MDIDNIKVKISWSNLNRIIAESALNFNVKDIFVKYQDDIMFSGKLKSDIPFLITVDNIAWDEDNIKFHIKDISLILKFRKGVKDFLIKRFIKGEKDKISYDDKDKYLVIKKSFLERYVFISDFKINSITADKDFVDIDLIDIKLNNSKTVLASEVLRKDMEEQDEVHEVKIEDFDVEKTMDYYDKLRNRIVGYIKNKIPQKYHGLIPYLLLLPDVLMLLVRLLKDNRVSSKDKALVGAAIAYIVSPFDVIADVVLPFGAIDDLGVAFFVLDKLILSVPKEVLIDNFNGNEHIIDLIKDGYSYMKKIIPTNKMIKMLDLFSKILKKKQ